MRCKRGVDLGDQLALAVARPQFDGAVGLGGGPVGEVGMVLALVVQVLQRLARLAQDVLFPRQKLLAEVLPLPFVHERLGVGRSVVASALHAAWMALGLARIGAEYSGVSGRDNNGNMTMW